MATNYKSRAIENFHLTVACLRRCPSQIGEPKHGIQRFAGEGNVGEARAAARRTPRGTRDLDFPRAWTGMLGEVPIFCLYPISSRRTPKGRGAMIH